MVAEIFGVDGLIVAVIAIAVIFGAKKIPEMARSVGLRVSSRRALKEGADLGSDDSAERVEPKRAGRAW